MKHVGKRLVPPLTAMPSDEALAMNMTFSAADIAKLGEGMVFSPKGVFRYRSHEEANSHQESGLAIEMAQFSKARRPG